jgi:hypothetical protein
MAAFKTRLNELHQKKIGLETCIFVLDYELEDKKMEYNGEGNLHIVVFDLDNGGDNE